MMMSVRRVLFACLLCVLWCGPGMFVAIAEETDERTKGLQDIIDKVVLMQYYMRSNVNSLLSYVKAAQTEMSVDNQAKWKLDTWKAEAGMKKANRSASSTYHGSEFVKESADAVHKSVTQLVELLKEALKHTQTGEKERAAARDADTWWGYALDNVSVQLKAAEKVPISARPAMEKMEVVANLMKRSKWDTMPRETRDALASALEALSEPASQAEELKVVADQAVLTLRSAQEITRGVKFQELKKAQDSPNTQNTQNTQSMPSTESAPSTPSAQGTQGTQGTQNTQSTESVQNTQSTQNAQEFQKLQEEKLKVVEELKEKLEKKTVDGLKKNGTLELNKLQAIVEAEGTMNGAGAFQDPSRVDGGLRTASHSTALLVPFVLACAAAAMTAA